MPLCGKAIDFKVNSLVMCHVKTIDTGDCRATARQNIKTDHGGVFKENGKQN